MILTFGARVVRNNKILCKRVRLERDVIICSHSKAIQQVKELACNENTGQITLPVAGMTPKIEQICCSFAFILCLYTMIGVFANWAPQQVDWRMVVVFELTSKSPKKL